MRQSRYGRPTFNLRTALGSFLAGILEATPKEALGRATPKNIRWSAPFTEKDSLGREILRSSPIDYSRYTGEKLREIRKTHR